jgi:hypothetical protein
MTMNRRTVLIFSLSAAASASLVGIESQVMRDLGIAPTGAADAQTRDLTGVDRALRGSMAGADRALRSRLAEDREFREAVRAAGLDPRIVLERGVGAYQLAERRAETVRRDTARGRVWITVARRELPAPEGIYLFPDGSVVQVRPGGQMRPIFTARDDTGYFCMCINPPENCGC